MTLRWTELNFEILNPTRALEEEERGAWVPHPWDQIWERTMRRILGIGFSLQGLGLLGGVSSLPPGAR